MDEKTKKTLTYLIRGLIIGFAIGGIIIYFIVEDNNLFFPFEDLNFKENEYFDFQSSSLHSRDSIITTSERLVLSLGFTNKQPYPLTIEPEVYTWVGKLEPTKEILPPTTYGANHGPTGKNNIFSAPVNEGENFFKVALKISYGNGTFIDYLNSTVAHNILSPESAIQERQSTMMFWSVIVAIFVGGGTVGTLVWTNKLSREEIDIQKAEITKIDEQNDFLKKQAKLENRAWLAPVKGALFHPTIQGKLIFQYKNSGKIPAFKVREGAGYSFQLITKEFTQSQQTNEIDAVVVPQQEVEFNFNYDHSKINDIQNGKIPFYIWIRITYDINQETNGEYGVIYLYNISTKTFDVQKEWTDMG